MAALATRDDQLAASAGGTNELDSCATASSVALCHRGTGPVHRSLVRVLVKATIRRHTTVTYVRLDGSRDESGGAGASPHAGAPELLLRSELSFVMSSSVLLSSPSHS
ncbi:unnamed protein product [Lota lota]